MTYAPDRVHQRLNVATTREIVDHLTLCDAAFAPPLSQRVDIGDYATRLSARAMRFEAWNDETLIGLVAAYPDHAHSRMFISNVSVLPQWRGLGFAAGLIIRCGDAARDLGMRSVVLELAAANVAARRLYDKLGFVSTVNECGNGAPLSMTLTL
jgi:ribosomal protein S18 acetylase RimI-like enzyme